MERVASIAWGHYDAETGDDGTFLWRALGVVDVSVHMVGTHMVKLTDTRVKLEGESIQCEKVRLLDARRRQRVFGMLQFKSASCGWEDEKLPF